MSVLRRTAVACAAVGLVLVGVAVVSRPLASAPLVQHPFALKSAASAAGTARRREGRRRPPGDPVAARRRVGAHDVDRGSRTRYPGRRARRGRVGAQGERGHHHPRGTRQLGRPRPRCTGEPRRYCSRGHGVLGQSRGRRERVERRKSALGRRRRICPRRCSRAAEPVDWCSSPAAARSTRRLTSTPTTSSLPPCPRERAQRRSQPAPMWRSNKPRAWRRTFLPLGLRHALGTLRSKRRSDREEGAPSRGTARVVRGRSPGPRHPVQHGGRDGPGYGLHVVRALHDEDNGYHDVSHHDHDDAFLERELWRGGARHLADLTGRQQRTARQLRDSR